MRLSLRSKPSKRNFVQNSAELSITTEDDYLHPISFLKANSCKFLQDCQFTGVEATTAKTNPQFLPIGCLSPPDLPIKGPYFQSQRTSQAGLASLIMPNKPSLSNPISCQNNGDSSPLNTISDSQFSWDIGQGYRSPVKKRFRRLDTNPAVPQFGEEEDEPNLRKTRVGTHSKPLNNAKGHTDGSFQSVCQSKSPLKKQNLVSDPVAVHKSSRLLMMHTSQLSGPVNWNFSRFSAAEQNELNAPNGPSLIDSAQDIMEILRNNTQFAEYLNRVNVLEQPVDQNPQRRKTIKLS